jgi:hypothetical protein
LGRDPVRLLHDIRAAQHELAAFATEGAASDPAARPELGTFLAHLRSPVLRSVDITMT